MQEKDAQRDELLSYFFTTINTAKNAPLATHKEAHKRLAPLVSSYKGIAYKTLTQKTAEITGLIHDAQSETYAPYIADLTLNDVLTSIETANNEYIVLDTERTSKNPEATDSKIIRDATDIVYQSMIDKTEATITLSPNEKALTLVTELNNLIDKTKALYNQRTARRGD
ncbi:MAG: DUF6261 family protein [Spirochaetales bacterium]